ncbi:MAG TPA: hypothetical protein VMI75_22745 [Polyangiaceae bacterium]|nr:hypothetical protein [Polyangiaceae bacterium]
MTVYCLGAKRDDEKRRTQKQARDFLRALHVGAPMPGLWSLESHEGPILDQGQTSSCTAHGTAQILMTNASVAGEPLPWVPSTTALYAVTRSIERQGQLNQPLSDSGAFPADVMAALEQWGVSPSRVSGASDISPSTVNDEADLMSLEQGALNLFAPEYRIDEYASDVVSQVMQALVGGFAVGTSFFADSAFMSYEGGAPVGAPNQSGPGGGHWTVLTSYRTADDGSIVFRGPNSWGLSYGDKGHHEVTTDWLRACWDLYTGPTPRKLSP